MAGDEFVRGLAVAVLAPAAGQHVFFLRLQHWEPTDLVQILRKTGFGLECRQCGGTGHDSALLTCPRFIGRRVVAAAPRADGTSMLRPRKSLDRTCSIPAWPRKR